MTGGWREAGRQGGRRVLPALLALLAAAPVSGQSLAERVAAVRDGEVRLSFATREGVCGNGRNVSVQRADSRWEPWCETGPARVALTVQGGEVVDFDTYVGGRWRDAGTPGPADLGTVPAAGAARFFLDLAPRTSGRVGRRAVFAASLADSITVWPALLELARRSSVPRETRKGALFWLAQAAGAEVVRDLATFVDNPDREIQEAAVFALSQLKGDAGVTVLMDIARSHADPKVRQRAMFWLGQSEDPRVLALFEEILLGR